MINLLLPINRPSKIRGLWLYKNKVYKDNLKIKSFKTLNNKQLKNYSKKYNQIALFYYNKSKGFLFDNNKNTIDILHNKKIIKHNTFKGLKSKIKKLLKKYNGITIYNKKGSYNLICYF